jgi:hypothetical protein
MPPRPARWLTAQFGAGMRFNRAWQLPAERAMNHLAVLPLICRFGGCDADRPSLADLAWGRWCPFPQDLSRSVKGIQG